MIKPYLRWFIVGLTLFFLLATLRRHWQEVSQVRLDQRSWSLIGLSLLVTSTSHVWAAAIWASILRIFAVRISFFRAIQVYLKTNLAKYLPGNIWHFYGRMTKVVESGSSWGVASLSVLLEPLLLAAAASIIFILGVGANINEISTSPLLKLLIPAVLITILVGLQPRFFNPVIQKVSKGKTKDHEPVKLTIYPWQPLCGEILFVLLRGLSFLLIWQAIAPLDISQAPKLIGVYSGAWLAGFIVPGAPGGLGVFETVMFILLETIGQTGASEGDILIILAIVRVVNTLAELLPLGLCGWQPQPKAP
ncbi:MAG: hypothetical protein WBB82_06050 [Limnothrix sp.]